jgi:von Willebrand factor type A domain
MSDFDPALLDGGVDGGADAGPVGCVPGVIELMPASPKVMFVLDRSDSMSSPFGGTSRWGALVRALNLVLPPVDQKMELGATIFPASAFAVCSVDPGPAITPAFGNVANLLTFIGRTRPAGHTPTADAITVAGNAILANRAASSARALVLATDGAPNCNSALNPRTCVCADTRCNQGSECLDDARTIETIRSFANQNLPTYVIGIQDQTGVLTNVLNRMAVAGGRPRAGAQSYYAVSSQSALETALTTIRNQVGACVFLTTSVPDALGSLALSVNGEVVPFDESGTNGWSWTNRENGELAIAGPPCLRLVSLMDAMVQANVVCATPDAGVDAGP